ncbi:MAG: hypothetical protein R3195_10460 [Gemmatimonadota bacterium]|nr:hypothetical protein [Gemmatimonadota bacterium]
MSSSKLHVLWWEQVEECVGAEGDIASVRFFRVTAPLDGPQFPCFDGQRCNGVWLPPDSVLLSAALVENERTVKHEMLHALLRTPSHSDVFFRCS